MVTLYSLLTVAFAAVTVNAAPSLEARQDGSVRATANLWQNAICQFPPTPDNIDRTFFNPGFTSGGKTRAVNTCYNETYLAVEATSFASGCKFNTWIVTNCIGAPSKTFDATDSTEVPSNKHCHSAGTAGQKGLSYKVTC